MARGQGTIAGSRVFEGRIYYAYGLVKSLDKIRAKKYAKAMRKQGGMARVVKHKKYYTVYGRF